MWATSWYWVNRSPCLFPLWAVWKPYFVFYIMLWSLTARGDVGRAQPRLFFLEYLISHLFTKVFYVPGSVSYPLCRRWCHNPWGTSQALDPFSGSTWNPHLHQSPSWLLPSRPIHHAPLPRGQGTIRIPNPLPASLSLEAECSNCGDSPPIPLAGVTWHTWAITFFSLTIFGLFWGWWWFSFSLFPARFICLLVLCGKEAPV